MHSNVKSGRSPASSAGAFESERRELARRSGAGVDVTLYWHPTLDELIVCVWDERHGAYFEIRPQRHLALDVYHHPYAHADLADEYEKEDRRAARDDLERSMAEQPWMLRLPPPAEGRR